MLGESAPAIATRLRAAAGLYKHCAETVLPPLHASLPGERPNELLASMAETMRLVCLAEAQAAAARRAPRSAARRRLIVKLHLGAHDLYARADKCLNDHVSDFNRISRKLQACILLGICAHRARAYRCAAEEAFAAGGRRRSPSRCAAAAPRASGGAARRRARARAWRLAMDEETEALASARNVYAKENEVVYFEKVPEKPAWRVPEGKVIVAEIAYERG